MRLLVDECVHHAVAVGLVAAGHDVVEVAEALRGSPDGTVLARAAGERRLLVTRDKDFGELVRRGRLRSAGLVLVRLSNAAPAIMLARLRSLIGRHGDALHGMIVVIDGRGDRLRRLPAPDD